MILIPLKKYTNVVSNLPMPTHSRQVSTGSETNFLINIHDLFEIRKTKIFKNPFQYPTFHTLVLHPQGV